MELGSHCDYVMELNDSVEKFRRNFEELLRRVQTDRISSARDCVLLRKRAVGCFNELILCRKHGVVAEHFEECLRLWATILQKYFKGFITEYCITSDFEPTLKRFINRSSAGVDAARIGELLSASATALDVDFDFVLWMLDQNLRGKSVPQRYPWKEWNVDASSLLMGYIGSSKMPMTEILIKRGFPYFFVERHFLRVIRTLMPHGGPLFSPFAEEYICFSRTIYSEGTLRLQLALELLVALFVDKNPEEKEMNERKQVLLWRALPFPFISGEELHQLLEPHYLGPLPLRKVCDAYIGGGGALLDALLEMKLQPRSLQHLARVQIRAELLSSRKKSIDDAAIDALGLPETLNNYIRLEY